MSNVDIAPIERDIANYKADIKILEALERLEKNKDYLIIIGKGYLETEALRLIKLRADPNMQSEHSQKMLMKDIDGVGSLQGYLIQIKRDADVAKKSLERSEEELEAVLFEQNQGV